MFRNLFCAPRFCGLAAALAAACAPTQDDVATHTKTSNLAEDARGVVEARPALEAALGEQRSLWMPEAMRSAAPRSTLAFQRARTVQALELTAYVATWLANGDTRTSLESGLGVRALPGFTELLYGNDVGTPGSISKLHGSLTALAVNVHQKGFSPALGHAWRELQQLVPIGPMLERISRLANAYDARVFAQLNAALAEDKGLFANETQHLILSMNVYNQALVQRFNSPDTADLGDTGLWTADKRFAYDAADLWSYVSTLVASSAL